MQQMSTTQLNGHGCCVCAGESLHFFRNVSENDREDALLPAKEEALQNRGAYGKAAGHMATGGGKTVDKGEFCGVI